MSNRTPWLLLVLCLVLGAGCATIPSARPLDPGMHEVGVSLGGPVLNLGGGTVIPVPNIVLQGRHGLAAPLNRPLDLTYGLNVMGLPFGILQGHVGVSWLLIHQNGPAPALSIADKQYFATNALGLENKPEATIEGWGANHIEVNFSWKIKRQVIYAGLSQYFDFGNPRLTLTPSFGVVLDTSPETDGGLMFHFDFRWYALNQTDTVDAIQWFPRPQGAFGFGGGMSFVFGKKRASAPELDEPESGEEAS